jgi:choline kinase
MKTRNRPAQVDCAVVLAAGMGSRLRSTLPNGDGQIKPLVPVMGVPIVVRSLMRLYEAGVAEAVIVTGYAQDEVMRGILGDPRLGRLRLRFAHNPDWRLQNGVSVLAARELVGTRPFFLAMGDHLYSPAFLSLLRASAPAEGGLALAIDRAVGEIHDIDDAVKVRLGAGDRILDLGKRLREFDAVDTGVFLATEGLFEGLEARRTQQGGDCSLVDGVSYLAAEGRAHGVDIGGAWWQDVDDYESLQIAERMLRREHDGNRQPFARL